MGRLPLLAAALLAPAAWAQDGPAGAERPPPRPVEETTPPVSPPPQAEDPIPGEASLPAEPPQRTVLRETDMEFSACLLALYMLGAKWEAGAEVTGEERDCGITRPVRLAEAVPGVIVEGAPPMRCEVARALGWWLRDHVIPAASLLPGAPRPVALGLGTTYECRGVVGGGGEAADLSEHAFGNAIDISAIRFDSGEPLEVARSGGSDLPAAFIAAIRGAACLYFTTVLGPGSNAAHDDHLHLDVKARNGGYRICE